MRPCFDEVYGNPSSIHHFGQMAKQRLEMARRQTAALLHCRPREVVFVSGGTEADNLAILGSTRPCHGTHVITTAIEHCVFTSRTSGQFRVTPEAAGAAHAMFADDIEQGAFLATVALEANDLKQAAKALALRHTARSGFRTYDLLHVASALLLGCDMFWSFDLKARGLAVAEGLALNPIVPR